jgi:hypothetical protein
MKPCLVPRKYQSAARCIRQIFRRLLAVYYLVLTSSGVKINMPLGIEEFKRRATLLTWRYSWPLALR